MDGYAAHSHADADGYGYVHFHRDADADMDSCATYRDANADRDANEHADHDSDKHADSYAHPNAYADRNGDVGESGPRPAHQGARGGGLYADGGSKMSASFLEFRERKAAARSAIPRLPEWASVVGYVEIGLRVPKVGEYFYAPIRDKILLCNAEETTAFLVVEYRDSR